MKLINLKRKQVEDIESHLESYDEKYTKQDLAISLQFDRVGQSYS